MKSFSPIEDFQPVGPFLSKMSIFGGIQEAEMTGVFRLLRTGIFKKGECVFRKGDDPAYIYIVKSGRIDLRITDAEVVLHVKELHAGECFGEASLMAMHRHTTTAVAVEESEIIVLSRHALIQLRHENIELFALLMMNIARELARRLNTTDDLLLNVLHARAKEGLASPFSAPGSSACPSVP